MKVYIDEGVKSYSWRVPSLSLDFRQQFKQTKIYGGSGQYTKNKGRK